MKTLHEWLSLQTDANASMTAKRLLAVIKERRISVEEQFVLIESSFHFVMKLDQDDQRFKSARNQIIEAWTLFCNQADDQLMWYYDSMLSMFEFALIDNTYAAGNVLHLSNAFVETEIADNRKALRSNHARVLKLIDAYIDHAVRKEGTDNEHWGGIAADLTHLYFYHTHYEGDDDLRQAVSMFIPKLVTTCYVSCNNITGALLKHHPHFGSEAANLIHYFVTLTAPNNEDDYGSFFYDIAYDFLGDSDFSLLKQKRTITILPYLETYLIQWTDVQFDFFTQNFVFYSLQENGIKLVAKSKDRQKVLQMLIATNRSTPMYDKIVQLFDDALALKSKTTKKQSSSTTSSTEGISFKDFNFKLVVIEELMYRQNILEPAFDLYAFVADYLERDINIEDEGYEIIPEAKTYFEELVLTSDHLAHVKELIFDGGLQIYTQIVPFWAGEDELFDVHSLEDASHLPNLTTLSVTSMLMVDTSELEQRGIVID
ncbi:hypothetical protein GC098_13860 [Paenibacillus sp. LMG 31458]|uniref:DUF6892 domain-containing protein n=1 Tax=Paenibacillus phytorum TaxID=2654977 RepID=A0ABX1XXQ4_9BACL|nr:hypothetical protein [Paenibacillus phytorum]NOU72499.1 hypothetical protein [Paenibacillus phytorum]